MPGIQSMRSIDDQPLRIGSRIIFTARGKERETEVMVCETERRITLRASEGAFTAIYRYALHPTESGVEITLDATCTASGFARIGAPLFRSFIRKADRWQLAYLKGEVEKEQDLKIRARLRSKTATATPELLEDPPVN